MTQISETALMYRQIRRRSCTGHFLCPDCGRKTVRMVLRRNGEDNYRCMYRRERGGCDFWVFTVDPLPADEAGKLVRLWNANPEHRDCCGLVPPPEWFLQQSMLIG